MSVAVVGDGSAFGGPDVEPALRRLADALAHATASPVHALRLGPDPFDLPAGVDAVVLAHTRPDHAWRIPAGTPVVADLDAIAVVLLAKLLTTLAAAGRTPKRSGVVVAGASSCPAVGPLLLAAGIRDITLWNEADARAFPLSRIASRAHAVIDPLDGLPARLPAPPVTIGDAGRPDPAAGLVGAQRSDGADDPGGERVGAEPADGGGDPADALGPARELPVIALAGVADLLLVLPGLLDALRRVPGASPEVDVLLASALALVMATPPDRRLPVGPSPALAAQVADAAVRSLRPTPPVD
ncbi:malate dehydrogenase (oxaloacetate-decarboxylating) [Saccharothrix tamanrassetensis]|uniref:Malate dehydrogenase (Oxaloacetate-decarboxylating) n=1 Tax=Saccharothrix tamanrassetensis TaxID=1051531 RepID=A0A841CMW3_9PSEU|nr:hypothetical protein [Saccharothrix tamanrassetensis]MBB5957468.1 malate dehydrogenase (oxaloacetate-decarboxylating) [Saccharothrix tamanrassetensis]